MDLLERKMRKLQAENIKLLFPGYDVLRDDANSVSYASKFFKSEFLKLVKNTNRTVHSHFTTGVDTNKMKHIIDNVKFDTKNISSFYLFTTILGSR